MERRTLPSAVGTPSPRRDGRIRPPILFVIPTRERSARRNLLLPWIMPGVRTNRDGHRFTRVDKTPILKGRGFKPCRKRMEINGGFSR
jgi:hypothetical protein